MKNNFTLPTNPQSANQVYADAFNLGNIEYLISLYEEGAKLISGEIEIIGKQNIKQALEKYLQLGGQMKIKNRFANQFENLAMLGSSWEIEYQNSKGELKIIKGEGSEIVRQQTDGTWLFIIDNTTSGK